MTPPGGLARTTGEQSGGTRGGTAGAALARLLPMPDARGRAFAVRNWAPMHPATRPCTGDVPLTPWKCQSPVHRRVDGAPGAYLQPEQETAVLEGLAAGLKGGSFYAKVPNYPFGDNGKTWGWIVLIAASSSSWRGFT
jgi:hypothetical protein